MQVNDKISNTWKLAWKYLRSIRPNLKNLEDEGRDPAINPFLQVKAGKALQSFELLQNACHKNEEHAKLINVYLHPRCRSAALLKELLFSEHDFKIDDNGQAVVDYIISKTYLDM